jgi:hypothetical protein
VPPDAADPEGCCHHAEHPQRAKADEGSARDAVPSPEGAPKQLLVPHAPGKPHRPRKRYSWAELLRRVFLLDVLRCPWCGGSRKLLAGIFDADAIHRLLAHLGLPTEPPELAPARAPPEPLLPW